MRLRRASRRLPPLAALGLALSLALGAAGCTGEFFTAPRIAE